MRKLALLLAAMMAVFAVPATVSAQDAEPTVGVAYVDDTIDGPIAEAVAALDGEYGHETSAVEAWTLFVDGAAVPDCVVTVGKDGDRIAAGLAYSTNGVAVRSAQGDDRHGTAVLVAEAVAACRR